MISQWQCTKTTDLTYSPLLNMETPTTAIGLASACGSVLSSAAPDEIAHSSWRTTDDWVSPSEQFNCKRVENGECEGLESFIPNEINRWEKLRDQMLRHSDLLKYTRRVVDECTSWSADEAFSSYLLDCLELDLAHGNEINREGERDINNKPHDMLQTMFPHEAERWESLRDRMLSIPYFDRYVHQNPDWSQDELFSSCLLDRLEEQLENTRPTNKSDVQPCTLDIVIEGASQQCHQEGKDAKEGAEKDEAVVEEEEKEKEGGEEEEEEEGGEEEEEESDYEFEDDSDDPDYVPEIIEPRPRRKPGRYSLPILPKENSSSSDSNEMDDTDTVPKLRKYKCNTCKKQLPTRFKMIQHFLTQHEEVHYEHKDKSKSKRRTMSLPPTMKVEDFATSLWYCKHCESYVAELKQHKLEKHQVCEVCGRTSATPALLKRHMETHTKTEDERRNLLCDYCGKRYIALNLFKNHLKVHRGEELKKYVCDICSKPFSYPKHLILHKRIHNNEKPFECTYCGRRFTQKYNMFKHTRVHTGVKPYSCDLCDESFNHNISLKNHKKKKHGIDWWNKGNLAVAPLPKSSRRKSKFTRKQKQTEDT